MWLLLFTLLLQQNAASCRENNSFFHHAYVLKVDFMYLRTLLLITFQTLFLKILSTYTTTQEILRNLESLLIYDIT